MNRHSRHLSAAALLLLAAMLVPSPAAAFIRATLSTTDATPLRWDLNETQQSLPNVVGGEIVYVIDTATPSPSFTDAIARAFQHWEGIGTSRVAFVRGTGQAIQAANNDGIDAVYIATTANTRIGGVNTNVSSFLSVTPVFSVASGTNKGIILDANIILNGRDFTWTTNPDADPNSYDLEAVVTHEIGHFIGLDHSGVLNATMSPRYFMGEARQRTLETDDILGASEIYPDGNYAARGSISGLVGRPAAVFGALLGVTDAGGRVVQESITASNGAYAAPGLDSGDYDVYVEPLDVTPPASTNLFDMTDLGGYFGDVYGPNSTVDPNFFASAPVLTTVTPPSSTTRSFLVGTVPPEINVSMIGGRASTLAGVQFHNGPTYAFAGDTNVFLGLSGPNMTSAVTLEFTGPGITINGPPVSGSVQGEPSVIYSISVASTAPLGLRSFRVNSGILGRTYATGALEIYPNVSMSLAAPGQFFTAPGEVNNGRLAGQLPLTLAVRGNDLDLDWDDEPAAYGYNVYRGTLASLSGGVYDHQAIPGTVNGACWLTTSYASLKNEALDTAAVYYLVTAYNNAGEGIVGRDSTNAVEPPASPACTAP